MRFKSSNTPLVPLALVIALASCGDPGAVPQDGALVSAIRDTLPNGAVQVRYAQLSAPVDSLDVDLRIGLLEGRIEESFGDVRAVEAGLDGTIYVLDGQAAELRSFGSDGSYRATLARRGQGPGELASPNGLARGPDGTLWVQDPRNRAILGFSPDGREIGRLPMLVRGSGYVWEGVVSADGFVRQTWGSAAGPRLPPANGLNEIEEVWYAKSFDPITQQGDSLPLGRGSERFFTVIHGASSLTNFPAFFADRFLAALDPAGGAWVGTSSVYRLARLGETGDTLVVLEVAAQGPQVTTEERDRWLEAFGDDVPPEARAAAMAPDRKPVIDAIGVDEASRLWVLRSVASGETPYCDVFDRDGAHLASVRLPLGFSAPGGRPPLVRGQHAYGVQVDSLGVNYVARARLPAALAGGGLR